MDRRHSFTGAVVVAVVAEEEEAAADLVEAAEREWEEAGCLDRRRRWVGRHPLAEGRDLAGAYHVQVAELVRAVLGRAELVLEGPAPEVEFPVAVPLVLAAASEMSADRLRRDSRPDRGRERLISEAADGRELQEGREAD